MTSFHVFGRGRFDEPRQGGTHHIVGGDVAKGGQRLGRQFADGRIPMGDFGLEEVIEQRPGVFGILGDEPAEDDEGVGAVADGRIVGGDENIDAVGKLALLG